MTNGNPRYPELRSHARAAGGLGAFQFSLGGVFLIVTAAALILSAYFSIGRLLGMSTGDVLTGGLGQLLFTIPTLLVWIVGLTMAWRRLNQNRSHAVLTMIALGGLTLTSLLLQLVQMALIYLVNSNQISYEVVSWVFMFLGALNAVLSTAFWILILVAIFAWRPADAQQSERNDRHGDPFATNEPDFP